MGIHGLRNRSILRRRICWQSANSGQYLPGYGDVLQPALFAMSGSGVSCILRVGYGVVGSSINPFLAAVMNNGARVAEEGK